jgi:hypothetical protein
VVGLSGGDIEFTKKEYQTPMGSDGKQVQYFGAKRKPKNTSGKMGRWILGEWSMEIQKRGGRVLVRRHVA